MQNQININSEDLIQKIPRYVLDIAEKLQKENYEAYLVGGSIRDVLLSKTPNDFDIATNAMPEKIIKIFPKSIPTGAQFGTITVVGEDENGEKFDCEVTTFRSEADYVGGRWPSKVEFAKSIEDDLSRRDFTINAMALNLQEFIDENQNISLPNIQEILVDPFDGYSDLEDSIIRAVRDPLERFEEDGLRPVRAIRLASQLDFDIEDETFEAIKQTNHITKKVSVERFRDEFLKLLHKSSKPSKGLYLLKDSGLLEIFIPELLEGIEITQPEFHEDDVFDHSLKTCDEAEDSIKLAALFHDIGKPRTISKDEKGTHFYGHDQVGAEMTIEIMKRLKFSNALIDRTVKLVRWHMFYYPSGDWRRDNLGAPNVAPEDEHLEKTLNRDQDESSSRDKKEYGWTDAGIRRLIKNVGGEDQIDDLMKLRIADASANPKTPFNPKEIDVLSKRIAEVRAEEMALKVTDLDITGNDLIKELGIEPGKQLGKILEKLLDLVIEEPIKNKRETLVAEAARIKNN